MRPAFLSFVIAVSALFVLGYGWVLTQAQGKPWNLSLAGICLGIGAVLGLVLGWFELSVMRGPAGDWLRRAPFAVAIALRTTVALFLITTSLLVGTLLFIPDRYLLLESSTLIRDVGVCAAFLFVLFAALQVRRIVGPGLFARFVLGRYHHPVQEERVFLFLDVADSTSLAERLGDLGVHALLSRFFFDIAAPIRAHGGETHRYSGDQVMVTWPLAEGLRDAACLRCCFAIADRIADRRATYERSFGVVPRFRIGLHAGPVVLGECGDDKLQLVYFGDTVNTAARVQEACKALGVDLLLTAELLARLEVPSTHQVEPLPSIRLRGRHAETALATVRAAPVGA